MKQRYVKLIIILLLLAVVIWVDLPNNPGIHFGNTDRNFGHRTWAGSARWLASAAGS